MDFSEALKLLKQGATIRRTNWSGTKRIILVNNSEGMTLTYIKIITKDGNTGVYTDTNCDILAADWVRS